MYSMMDLLVGETLRVAHSNQKSERERGEARGRFESGLKFLPGTIRTEVAVLLSHFKTEYNNQITSFCYKSPFEGVNGKQEDL